MKRFYNIIIWIYIILIKLFSLFNSKAHSWSKGQKNIFKTLEDKLKRSSNIVWFHCASLGEYEQGKPIISAYKLRCPKHKILLTFFSPSGYKIKKESEIANWIFYMPADTKSNARKFINIVSPIKVFFIKYEFWFNYMNELKLQSIPLYSVSSIFRDTQYFFKFKWCAKQLLNITHFFVQDQKSAQLLISIGISNVTVTGDTRFDCVKDNTKSLINIPLIALFSKNKNTIVFGSTWKKDEILAIKYISDNPHNNYIIAPHELKNISHLQKQTGALLYSKVNTKNIHEGNILIIDSIGILPKIYKYGNIAYIGGGFGTGIHNILEATAFGLGVIFGPKYQKSNEAINLIEKKAAISISNYKDLCSAINHLSSFNKSIALNYIEKNSGATNKILSAIV